MPVTTTHQNLPPPTPNRYNKVPTCTVAAPSVPIRDHCGAVRGNAEFEIIDSLVYLTKEPRPVPEEVASSGKIIEMQGRTNGLFPQRCVSKTHHVEKSQAVAKQESFFLGSIIAGRKRRSLKNRAGDEGRRGLWLCMKSFL